MLFVYARRRGIDARWAAIVALSSALATQLLPYATIFMLHVPSAALLLYALTTPHRARAGFAAALATAMNYLCAPALIVFAFLERRAIASLRRRRPRAARGAGGLSVRLLRQHLHDQHRARRSALPDARRAAGRFRSGRRSTCSTRSRSRRTAASSSSRRCCSSRSSASARGGARSASSARRRSS